jgi:hypothetical protein
MADHVVRPVKHLALELVDQRRHRSVGLEPGHNTAVPFAIYQPPLKIECGSISANSSSYHFRLLPKHHAVQQVGSDIDKVEKPLRVPQRPLGEHEPARHFFQLRRLQNIGQSCHSRVLPYHLASVPRRAPLTKGTYRTLRA